MNYFVQHLKAPSDVNGNPRRVYLIMSLTTGETLVRDEGYEGFQGLPQYVRDSYWVVPSVDITVTQYKNLLKSLRNI